ncbi:hypothetical protein PQR53_00855 [Paraburkholderia fungorum]|uniref:hypothetical protein n=1 Tax=Paraburkholderia fungorum TaxID=134537 RepID=UPI0038B78313
MRGSSCLVLAMALAMASAMALVLVSVSVSVSVPASGWRQPLSPSMICRNRMRDLSVKLRQHNIRRRC